MFVYDLNIKEKTPFSSSNFRATNVSMTVEAPQTHLATIKSQQFSSSFCTTESLTFVAKSTTEQAAKSDAVEKLSSVKSKKSCIPWYRLTVESKLKHLLELARSKEQVKLISQEDLNFVINCCDYKDNLVLSNCRKLTRLSIEILSYFAEYKISLPGTAIEALIFELRRNDQRTLGNILYTLCLAIHNGQVLADQELHLLNNAIRIFFEQADKCLNISVIVLGFLVLTKQEIKLEQNELDYLKKTLSYFEDSRFESHFPRLPIENKYHSKDRYCLWYSFNVLGPIKSIVSKNELLSKKEIKFVIRHWRTESSFKKKLKVIQILRYVILNKQNDFEDPAALVDVLKEAIDSPVRKIRAYAIVAAGYLVKLYRDKSNNPYKALASKLDESLNIQRLQALQTIKLFLEKPENSSKLNQSWKSILNAIKEKPTTDIFSAEISKKTRYILSILNGDAQSLEELILDEVYCIEASYLLAQKSEQKVIYSEKTLKNLGTLISDAKYPLEVKINAAIVLNNVAMLNQQLPIDTLCALVTYSCESDNLSFRNSAWSAIGYYASKYSNQIINNKCLLALNSSLSKVETALNAAFALKSIVETLSTVEFESCFSQIFHTIGLIIDNKDYSYSQDVIYNALLVLLHSTKKGFFLSLDVINKLGNFTSSLNCSDTNKCIALEVVNFVIQSKKYIELGESLLLQLICVLQSSHKIIRNNVTYILLAYFDKSQCNISQKVIIALVDLLKDDSLSLLVLELLKKITINLDILDKVSNCLLKTNEELRIAAALILKKAANQYDLSDICVLQLQQALDDSNKTVQHTAISALKKCFSRNHTIVFSFEACIALARLIKTNFDMPELQADAAELLYLLASHKQRFCSYVIHELGEILKCNNIELKNNIIKIITCQFGLYIDFKNKVFILLIKNLENLLLEEELSINVIMALGEANKNGYSISSMALEKLACFLLTSPDVNIRSQAYKIISKVNNDQLSKEIKQIQALEADGILLQFVDSVKETTKIQYDAAYRLRLAAKNKQYLTLTVFVGFESVMNSNHEHLYEEVTQAVYFAMQNDQPISNNLLESFARFVQNPVIKTDKTYAIKALVFAAKKGHFLSAETFSIFEELFLNKIKSELYVEYLQAIELKVKRFGDLKPDVSEKIYICLYHADLEVQYFASRVIYTLVKNKKYDSTGISIIINRLEYEADERLIKYLCKTIVSYLVQFPEQSIILNIDIFKKLLINVEDDSLKEEITKILKCLGYCNSKNSAELSTAVNKDNSNLLESVYDVIDSIFKNNNTVLLMHKINFVSFFKDRVLKLIRLNWSIQKLHALLVALKNDKKKRFDLESIVMAFDIAYCYGLNETKFYKQDFLSFNEDTFVKLHQSAIKKCFIEDEGEKGRHTLLDEIANLAENKNTAFVNEYVTSGKILSILEKINSIFNSKIILPSKYKSPSAIKDWQIADIQAWSEHIKAITKQEDVWPEMFAVIRRAIFLQWKYQPRNSQIIAVLALLSGNRLAEIPTGEGKTVIIAIWAVIKALYKIPVDIVTSSSILAKRDAKLNKEFYQMFNLKVASNEDDKSCSKPKKCYSKNIDIIYGDLSNFQFDLLREEYSLLGTRDNREFGAVIIDEVDNLLIDGASKVAMLSSSMPGIKQLHSLMIFIWQELQKLLQQIIAVGNKIIYEQEGAPPDNKKIFYEIDNSFNFVFTKLQERILSLIDDTNPLIIIPNHLKDFARQQLPKWIRNALIAHFEYKENHHYKIGLNQLGVEAILPLDFANTGQTQSGTTWSDGLQQFLQIKHGLKFTPETLITNLMSNSAFINRYKGNICGLTGTLGTQQTRAFLASYGVDFVDLPSHKTKRFLMLPGIVAQTQELWMDEVVINAIKEAKAGRVILILCETIEKAKKVYEQISKSQKSGHIKPYIESDSDQSRFLDDTLKGNTIIVATNLAGRGTDPKISEEVIKKYGTHVIFTFLPINSRVHQQGLGRAGRAGNPGTGQVILNLQDLYTTEEIKSLKPQDLTLESIIKQRDKQEALHLEHFQDGELQRIKVKDQLFSQFCELLKELKEIDQLDKNKPLDKSYYQCKRQAIEERWGLWLKQLEIKPPFAKIEAEFATFKEQILKDYKNDIVIQNPFYYIRYANELLNYADSIKGKVLNFLHLDSFIEIYKSAVNFYDKAIALDPIYGYLAYYYKAYALVKLGDDEAKYTAKKCLTTAKEIIENHVNKQLLATVQVIPVPAKNSELSHQLSYELHMLENLSRNIEEAIEIIDRTSKKIDVTFSSESISMCGLLAAEASHEVSDSESSSFNLSFYHFKAYTDVKRICEAESVLSAMPSDATVNIIFSAKTLKKSNRHQQVWCELLPINQEVKTKEDKKKIKSEKQVENAEILGLYEHLSAAKTVVVSKVGGLFKKAKDVVDKKIITPLGNWWDDYETVKKIPVNICFSGLSVIEAEKILEQLKKLSEAELKVEINYVKKNTLIGIQAVKIEQALHKLKAKRYRKNELKLVFSNIPQEIARKVLTVAPQNTTLNFATLSKQEAKKILYFTAEHHDEAIFEFTDLTKKQALKLIKKVPEERPLEATFQPLEAILPQTSFAVSELLEYQANGLFSFLNLAEQKPTPWRSILLLTTCSLLQIAVGFALTALSAGFVANVATALTIEGICDGVRALNVFRSGQFDLSSYLFQKAVSLSWSLATSGYSALSAASKAASTSEKLSFTLTEVADEAAIQVIVTAKSMALKSTAQNLVTTATRVAVQEGTSVVLDTGIHYASHSIQKSIQYEVIRVVERLIEEVTFQRILQRSFTIDVCLENEVCQTAICDEVQKQIRALNNKSALGINKLQPVLDSYAISQMLSEFEVNFAKVMCNVKLPSFMNILHIKLQAFLNKAEISEICEILKCNHILDDEDNINLQPLCIQRDIVLTYTTFTKTKLDNNRLNLHQFNQYKNKIIDICVSFYMASADNHFLKKDRFIQTTASGLTNTIVKIMDSITDKLKGEFSGIVANLAGAATSKVFDKLVSKSAVLSKDINENAENHHGHFSQTQEVPKTINEPSEQASNFIAQPENVENPITHFSQPQRTLETAENVTNSPLTNEVQSSSKTMGASATRQSSSAIEQKLSQNAATKQTGKKLHKDTSHKPSDVGQGKRSSRKPFVTSDPNPTGTRLHSDHKRFMSGDLNPANSVLDDSNLNVRGYSSIERFNSGDLSLRDQSISQNLLSSNSKIEHIRSINGDRGKSFIHEHIKPKRLGSIGPSAGKRPQLITIIDKDKNSVVSGTHKPSSHQNLGQKSRLVSAKNTLVRPGNISTRSIILPTLNKGNDLLSPAAIFGFNNLDKFLFELSVSTVKNVAVIKYQKILINEYSEKLKNFREKLQEYLKNKSELDDQLIDEARKIIKLLLGLFILEIKYSMQYVNINIQADNFQQHSGQEFFNQEEIIYEIEELFKKCVEHPDQEYDVLSKHFQGFNLEQIQLHEILSTLKQSFLEFYQLIKGAKNMLDAAAGAITKFSNDVNLGDLTGKILKSIDDRNYTQTGLLLREGNLSETGYLAGSMIEGILKAQQLSAQSQARVQYAMTEIVKTVAIKHEEFKQQLLVLNDRRIKVLELFTENVLKRAFQMYEKTLESNDHALMDKAYKAIEAAERMLPNYIQLAQTICPTDPAFIERCMESSKALVTTLSDTLKVIAKEQTSGLTALITSGKELLMAGMANKQEILLKKLEVEATKSNNNAQVPAIHQQAALPQIEAQPIAQANPLQVQIPQPQAVPTWKASLDAAHATYAKGKQAFKTGDKVSAAAFFQQAKDDYKDLQGEPLDQKAKARLEKRLNNLKGEGKYSSIALTK